MANGCRAVGLTTLEAIATSQGEGDVIVALDGRRGDLFVQFFRDGRAQGEARAISVGTLPEYVKSCGTPRIVGPEAVPTIDPVAVARLALRFPDAELPRPLYLRAPDAKIADRLVLR